MSQLKRSKRPPVAAEIQSALLSAAHHTRKFAPLTREQVDLMARAYRATLTERRRAGRKPGELTLKVAKMLRDGLRWADVFRRLGYNELDKYERTYKKDQLRKVVNAYLRRNGLKSRAAETHPGVNP